MAHTVLSSLCLQRAVLQAGWVQLGLSACFTLCLLMGMTSSDLLHHVVPLLLVLQTARYICLVPGEHQLPQLAFPS